MLNIDNNNTYIVSWRPKLSDYGIIYHNSWSEIFVHSKCICYRIVTPTLSQRYYFTFRSDTLIDLRVSQYTKKDATKAQIDVHINFISDINFVSYNRSTVTTAIIVEDDNAKIDNMFNSGRLNLSAYNTTIFDSTYTKIKKLILKRFFNDSLNIYSIDVDSDGKLSEIKKK